MSTQSDYLGEPKFICSAHLKILRDASGQSDPIAVVSALGKKGETAVHKATTICVWDHLFVSPQARNELTLHQHELIKIRYGNSPK